MRIVVDGKEIEVEKGRLVDVLVNSGFYVPNLCHHPNVSPASKVKGRDAVFRGKEKINGTVGDYDGCGLCYVKINGNLVKACEVDVEEGMNIITKDDEIERIRKENLAKILANHPHVCITCPYREGCDRISCTFGYPTEERCCDLFPKCELRFIAEFIGVPENTPKYVFKDLPVVEEKLYRWDWNYCINCTRCVRGCSEVRGAEALSFTVVNGGIVVGRTAEDEIKSGCKFCGVCVEICPTGVVRDKKKHTNKWRESIVEKVLPQLKKVFELNEENIKNVPESPGVFRLYDENMEIVYIKGAPNLREALSEEVGRAKFFDFEEHEMFTMRESELIQEFLQKHGRMPRLNDELDDLFDDL